MKNKFALISLIGLVGGLFCVIITILEVTDDYTPFMNYHTVIIVGGGTVFALMLGSPIKSFKTIGSVLKQAFISKDFNYPKTIETLVQLSEYARAEGLLSLEKHTEELDDPFLKKGLRLMLDGTKRDDLEDAMMGEVYQMQQRHRKGQTMANFIANSTPAFGLIGAYIGLIPMLVRLDDPVKLGPLMAIELASNFYGAFLSYAIFAPIAKHLILKTAEEKTKCELQIEGLLAILDAKNPREIREQLLSYVTKKEAKKVPDAGTKS